MPEPVVPGHWSTRENLLMPPAFSIDTLRAEGPKLDSLINWWLLMQEHPTLPEDVTAGRNWVLDTAAVHLVGKFPTAAEGGKVRRDVLLAAMRKTRPQELAYVLQLHQDEATPSDKLDDDQMARQWRPLEAELDAYLIQAYSWLTARYLRPSKKRGLYLCSPSLTPTHLACVLDWTLRRDWEAGVCAIAAQPDVGSRWLKYPVRAEAWQATCDRSSHALTGHPNDNDRWLSAEEWGLTLKQLLYHDPDERIPSTMHPVIILHKWPGRSNADVRKALSRALTEMSTQKAKAPFAGRHGMGSPTDYSHLMNLYRAWHKKKQEVKRLTIEDFASAVREGSISIDGVANVLDLDTSKSLIKARRWLEADDKITPPWSALPSPSPYPYRMGASAATRLLITGQTEIHWPEDTP